MPFEAWLYSLPMRLRSRFRPNQLDQELKEELREHLEQQIEHNVQRGMSSEEARYSALRALGGLTQIEEQCREARGGRGLRNFLQDLRYGFRQLRRAPGFAALTILCLTLGIGANAAVFSWLEGILFRPYPLVAHQERLLALAATPRGETRADEMSWPFLISSETAPYVKSSSSARLPAAPLVSETTPRPPPGASSPRTTSTRSVSTPFLVAASKRATIEGTTPIQSS